MEAGEKLVKTALHAFGRIGKASNLRAPIGGGGSCFVLSIIFSLAGRLLHFKAASCYLEVTVLEHNNRPFYKVSFVCM